MHPLKWKRANECRLHTVGKIEVVLCIRGVGVGGEE